MSSAGLSPIDTGIGASCSRRRVVVRMAEPRRRANAPKDTLYREILDEANDHPRLLDSQAGAGQQQQKPSHARCVRSGHRAIHLASSLGFGRAHCVGGGDRRQMGGQHCTGDERGH